MSDLDSSQELFNSSCATNSEPFALQNLGDFMTPEFSENCILIIDPGMAIHNMAYVIIRYEDELYFRQYLQRGGRKFMLCLNQKYAEIELKGDFEVVGCVVQQKQRKQKPLHYYHLNIETKELDFCINGRVKVKGS